MHTASPRGVHSLASSLGHGVYSLTTGLRYVLASLRGLGKHAESSCMQLILIKGEVATTQLVVKVYTA